MSGGNLDYFYFKVDCIADEIRDKARTPLHKAFVEHLYSVSEALHDIEWLFSGDYVDGDETEAIKKVLGSDYKSKTMDVLKSEAKELIKELQKYIDD